MMGEVYENGVILYSHHYNLSKINSPLIYRGLNRAKEMLGYFNSINHTFCSPIGSLAGASATTQKTLTVVIKYDKKGLVKDFSYHASKF